MADVIVVIDRGRVQQVGEPLEVYEKPRSLFVATFIGSPPANTLPANVELVDGYPLLRVAGGVYRPGEGEAAKIREAGLDRVVVGFRPEHARLAEEEPEGEDLYFEAEVYLVERMGRENIVTLEASGMPVKVVTPPDVVPEGKLYVVVPRDRVLLFEPDTGLNLAYL